MDFISNPGGAKKRGRFFGLTGPPCELTDRGFSQFSRILSLKAEHLCYDIAWHNLKWMSTRHPWVLWYLMTSVSKVYRRYILDLE